MYYSPSKIHSYHQTRFPRCGLEDNYTISISTQDRLIKEKQIEQYRLRRNKTLRHFETTLGSSPKYMFYEDFTSEVYKALSGRPRPTSLLQMQKMMKTVERQKQALAAFKGVNGGNSRIGRGFVAFFKSFQSQVKPSSSTVNSSVPKKLKLVKHNLLLRSRSNSKDIGVDKPKPKYEGHLGDVLLSPVGIEVPDENVQQNQESGTATVNGSKSRTDSPPKLSIKKSKASDLHQNTIKDDTNVVHEVNKAEVVKPKVIQTFATEPTAADFTYGISKMHSVHEMLVQMYQEETENDMDAMKRELQSAKEKSLRRYQKLRRIMNDSTTEIQDLFRS